MTTMRKLPIGIQSFENIRNENYLYVDKTALIYQLVTKGKPYFLSRPRRFGKSLLISTLEAYFQGKKELFKGLAIDQLEQDWNVYPVLYFSDLNQLNDISLDYDYATLCGITHAELVDRGKIRGVFMLNPIRMWASFSIFVLTLNVNRLYGKTKTTTPAVAIIGCP